MDPQASTRIAAELAGFETLLEVGVGRRFEIADTLVERGCLVTAIDVVEQEAPAGVRFRRADVLDLAADADPSPSLAIPGSVDAVYALNLPEELQQPTVDLAERLDAVCLFTTLGFEEPVIPVQRSTVGGETLYVARGELMKS